MDTWKLAQDKFSLETLQAFEGLFTLGSGYLHTRGSFEEHFAGCEQNSRQLRKPFNVTAETFRPVPSKWGTYVPGIFGQHPFLLQEMINLPWFLELAPVIEGQRLDLLRSRFSGFRCELDMRTASLTRSLLWELPSGNRVQLRFERFISRARTGLSVQRLTMQTERPTDLTVHAGITADVTTNGFDHFIEVSLRRSGEAGVECSVVTDDRTRVTMRSLLSSSAAPTGTSVDVASRERDAQLCQTFRLERGVRLTVEKRTAVSTSRDLVQRPVAEQLAGAAAAGWDSLFAEHAALWERAWAASDVVIEGDDRTQQILRCSIYHLLRAHVPGDTRVGIDAKGYAGEAYKGHFFWDTEIYLLPFYLYTDPESAKTLIDFRVGTLPEARKLAAAFGYAGARYPWESDAEGRECCCEFQYRDHEVHVTADVIYGLAHYFRATGRRIEGAAAEAVVETARYWLDRLDWRPGDDHPSLLGVMGPDEYAPLTHNNSYTNRMVALNLSLAAEVGASGGATSEECRAFAEAAAALPIVRSRTRPDLILQCEGFEQLAAPRFEEFWADRRGCYAARVSQERLYRSQNLKQADVILLLTMFPEEFTDAEVRAAWDYYLPVTTHDSSLSAGIHAMAGLRLGLFEESWRFFMRSAGIDLDVAHGGAAQGIHIAGCAANWQVVVLGFGGLRTAMQADTLTLRPSLPPHWTKLAFPVVWHGTPLRVAVTAAGTALTNEGEREIDVRVWGRDGRVAPGQTVMFPVASREWGGPNRGMRPAAQ